METTDYIDTHAHLSMLTHSPLDEILDRAAKASVKKMVTVSTEEGNWNACQAIAEKYGQVYYALGVHPHDASKWDGWKAALESRFPNHSVPTKCVGIGETGLDFHYTLSPKDVQIRAFEDHIRLAKATNLPLIIHCRDAFPELYSSLKSLGLGKRGAVLHCFTGTYDEAKQGLEMGLKISFSGILTFKKSEELRTTAAKLPASQLLIETDCPYLAPIPFRGKPNEPSFLPETAKVLAEQLRLPLAKLGEQLFEQSVRFFSL